MSRRGTASVVTVTVAGAVAGAAAITLRRWGRAHDPTAGPLTLPPGRERRVIADDGVRLAVFEAGPEHGPAVVLAHCWVGDRRIWGGVARRLVERGCRVVLYDHRGHGASDRPVEPVTLERLADDLAAVLATVPAERVVLAGHSLGGMTAQALAARHPASFAERVAALGLVATATDGLAPPARAQARALAVIGSAVCERALAPAAAAAFWLRRSVGRRVCRAHLDALRETFLATPAPVRASCLAAMHAMDLSAALARVTVPVAILVGERDRLTPPGRSRRMATVVPHARLELVPDAGHMLPWEEPDRVAAALVALAAAAGMDPGALELAS